MEYGYDNDDVWNDLGNLDRQRGQDWEDDRRWNGWNYTTRRSLADQDWANSGWNNSSSLQPNFMTNPSVYEEIDQPTYREIYVRQRYLTPTRQATYMAGQNYLPLVGGSYDLDTNPYRSTESYNLTRGSLSQTPDYSSKQYY